MNQRAEWRLRFRGASLYAGLAAIFIAGCLLEPSFLTLDNQRDVLQRVSLNGILAVGMTLVILTGGIDLSVGSMMSLCSVLCAMLVMGREWSRGCALAAGAGGLAAAVLVLGLIVRRRQTGGVGRVRLALGVAGGVAAGAAVAGWVALQARTGFGVIGVLALVPAVGALLGAVSGSIVARGRLQPFIVTLAMMIALVGLAKYVAGKGGQIHAIYVLSAEESADSGGGLEALRQQLAGEGKGFAPESFAALGRSLVRVRTWDERRGRTAEAEIVPVTGLFFLGAALAAHLVLTRLRFGRHVYAVGGSEETARFSGIDVASVKTGVYAISGAMAGLAAVLYGAMYGQGKPDAGQMGELDAIAAVVIGGTSLMGGRGRMAGTVVGVLIFGYLNNILVLKGISSEIQDILKGVIIVAAVLLQEGMPGRWAGRMWRRGRGAA